MNFRIEQYKIFNVVAKSQSFSKAAKELFMTQSAVSQAIKQLCYYRGYSNRCKKQIFKWHSWCYIPNIK